jgi:hypothetical protein
VAHLLPALLVALFAGWCGTLPGAAGAWGAAAGQAAAIGAALAGARSWDPLRLGRAGRLLPAALLVAVLASWWASPVERAGRVGVLLLPACLLLPAAVERWWRDPGRRRLGLGALAITAGALASWALADWLAGGSPRPAAPLGHHNLLAACLVILLPLSALGLRRRGLPRGLSAAAVGLALLAVALSRSATGLAALAAQAAWAAWALPRLRRPLALAAVLALLAGLPRLARIGAGTDASAAARRVYLEAGWSGFARRPLLGWGPGSVPWTVGAFLRPRPGVTPPGEVVGQLHSVPLEWAYELGSGGALVAIGLAAAFVRRRFGERREASDPELAVAALAALLGAAVTALGNSWLAVPALTLAVAVAAGASLAAAPPRQALAPRRTAQAAAALWAALALALLAPLALAHAAYDRAARAPSQALAEAHLAQAVELDPSFPLYAARLAWYRPEPDPLLARRAAERAPGVAALWLSAGVLDQQAGGGGWPAALRRALALDPLSGLAAYYLAKGEPEAAGSAACAARALLGEPRLAAAIFWEGREALRREAGARLLAWEGVDPGWREAMAGALAAAAPTPGPEASLGIGTEGPEGGLSLFAFGRLPWPVEWFSEPLDAALLPILDLPPAATLPASRPQAFPPGACAP